MRFRDKDIQDELNKRSENVTEDDVKKVFVKREEIEKKFSSNNHLGKFISDMKVLYSLLKDYRKGVYRQVPWSSIAAIVGALLYVFSPIDLIPDFIPIIGLLDDAAVIALCLKMIDVDLQAYVEWKKNNVVYDDNE